MAGNKIRGITIELNADTAGIMSGLKDINSALGTTQRSLNDVNKLLKVDPGNVTLLAQKEEYLESAINQANEKLKKEKELLDELKNAANADETVEQQKALEREIASTTKRLDDYETELEETKGKLSGVAEETGKAEKSSEGMASSIQMLAQSEAFSRIAQGAQEIKEMLEACDDAADRFETSMAKVETLAKQGDGLSKWADQIKINAQEVGVYASDMAEAVYQALSAGVKTEDAIEFANKASKLAIGGFTDTATAVDITTTAINAYGLSMDDADHIMDNFVTTQNLGKTTVAELAAAMGKAIPMASAYGVDIDNISAAYAELTAKGISTKIATTDLNAMLKELGTEGTGVARTLKEKTGKSFKELMDSGKNLGEVLNILWQDANKDSAAFMGMWGQSTASIAAFNLASDSGEKFNDVLQAMETNVGAVETNFDTMADTGERAAARFESATENFKIAVGDAMSPVLDTIEAKGTEALKAMTDFVEENPAFVAAIGGAVTAVAGVAGAIASVAAAIALARAAFGDLSGIASVLGGAALLGGVAGLTLELDSAAKNARTLVDTVKDGKDEFSKSSETYKANSAKISELGARIKELNSVENLSTDQQLELAAAVQEWNSLVGESNQLIVDNTGHIVGNTEAINDNIDAAERQYKIEQNQQELQELTRKYAEAKDALAEADKRVAEAEAQTLSVSDKVLMEQGYIVDNLALEKKARDEIAESCEEYQKRYEELTGKISDYKKEQDEANGVLDDATGKADDVKEALEELQKEYDKTLETSRRSLEGQREKFEELEEGSAKSVDNMAEKMQTQVEGMKIYASNIEEAYRIMQERADSSKLFSDIISKGPEANDELESLTKAYKDNTSAFDDMVAAYNESEQIIDKIAQYQSALETGYTQPLDNAIQIVPEKTSEINEAFSESYEEMEENAQTNADNMVTITQAAVENMAEAVENGREEVLGVAVKALGDGAVQTLRTCWGVKGEGKNMKSQVFYDLGYNVDVSLAQGIDDGTSLVEAAVERMCERIIESIDVGKLARKIDAKLAAAFG